VDAFYEHHCVFFVGNSLNARKQRHRAPIASVRCDSLLEQRGFEPPVLFGLRRMPVPIGWRVCPRPGARTRSAAPALSIRRGMGYTYRLAKELYHHVSNI